MIIANIDHIPGKEFEGLGLVRVSTIQSRHMGKDIMSELKTLVDGELTAYTEMLNAARAQATKRMVDAACRPTPSSMSTTRPVP